jgi:hypothetical protein
MNIDTSAAAHDWDIDISNRELCDRLTNVMRRARNTTPILDDDDLEAAIDEAADRLTPDAGWPRHAELFGLHIGVLGARAPTSVGHLRPTDSRNPRLLFLRQSRYRGDGSALRAGRPTCRHLPDCFNGSESGIGSSHRGTIYRLHGSSHRTTE